MLYSSRKGAQDAKAVILHRRVDPLLYYKCAKYCTNQSVTIRHLFHETETIKVVHLLLVVPANAAGAECLISSSRFFVPPYLVYSGILSILFISLFVCMYRYGFLSRGFTDRCEILRGGSA